jgi:hypothetical protein
MNTERLSTEQFLANAGEEVRSGITADSIDDESELKPRKGTECERRNGMDA